MTDQDPIRILLADDHMMVREGLAALVNKDPGIEVVGQCGDGLEVIKCVAEVRPDVLILDITMPRLNGMDVCREVAAKYGDTHVLILTMHNDEQFIARSLENGACGYLLKEAAAEQLSQAVRAVARGELYLGPGISRSVIRCMTSNAEDPYNRLTMREKQVLLMVAEGKTNNMIAEELGLRPKTVDTHRTRLMRKLNIHDQTSLVKYALKRGLVQLA